MKNFKITQSITDRKDESLSLYFKDVSKLSMITQEEEIKLAKKIQKGDINAENQLVKANLRFVISVAKQYQNKGLDLVDLIQEGNLGLIKSARLYDPNKGYKFISYAVWWIRQSIMKAISDQCRTVRVPMNHITNMSKINKISEKFEQENGRIPSKEELENLTELDSKRIDLSYTSTYRSISLETPLRDDDANCLLDIIPNENIVNTDCNLIKSDLQREVDRIITKLPSRESDIIRMYFGIEVQKLSNEEIADRFGIGTERVRQLIHSGIDKLKKRFKNNLLELL
nr:MAG TPA: DNA directed RNA polymerase subunit [Caudoviricetes sp.]